jgi:hypothetical protein
MEVRGFATVESSLKRDNCQVDSPFEAFRIMQEINALKARLEKALKGNKALVGAKELVEAGFKSDQHLTLQGPDFNIVRSKVVVGPKMCSGYEFWKYDSVQN